jgi:phosphatidylglycerophosphate synthase
MNKGAVFSIFSEEEEAGYLKFRDWRDRLFAPVTFFLARHGVSAIHLSITGLLMVLPFVFFFKSNPWMAFIFLLLNVFFDSLDGPLARRKGLPESGGSVIDFACDHLGFFVIFMTFFFYQLLSPFWGAIYLVNYSLMLSMVIFCRALKIRFFPVIRSKYYIFLIFFIWLVSGYNYFDPTLVFFSVYMAITNFFLFDRIRCSIR